MSFQIKKIEIPKILSTWVFAASKYQQNFKILQLAWTLTPNQFWTKCLRCLIVAQEIVFHSYFMEITSFIFIWLQLNHYGSSNLLKNFSKLIFLAILSYIQFLTFLKKWNFYFLLICINLLIIMKPEKMKSLSEVEDEIKQLKNCPFLLLWPPFKKIVKWA